MTSSDKPTISLPRPLSSGRHASPSPPGLRQRPLGRASTFASDGARTIKRRRSSILSDGISAKSLRSSTDNLLLPRVTSDQDLSDHDDDNSHWHSLPLVLALLPAVGGLLIKNGSAVITDFTLLGVAAIFMNWALRSPWDWYRAAQARVPLDDVVSPSAISPIDELDEDEAVIADDANGEDDATTVKPQPTSTRAKAMSSDAVAAQRELRIHELLALLSCFVFPAVAAWLLHTIRSQLSRPSEGLVSNYNLMIFILVAEIRPLSHAIKLTQRRTLFLQRRANMDELRGSSRVDAEHFDDLSRRLNELEIHVADRAIDNVKQKDPEKLDQPPTDVLVSKAANTAISELRKIVQPELDALNRAMRRYEKRSTISAVQTETRLQDLENRVNDVVSLAAAAQRNADKNSPNNHILTLTNWACALVVVPTQYLLYVASIPSRALDAALSIPRQYLFGVRSKAQQAKEARSGPRRRSKTTL